MAYPLADATLGSEAAPVPLAPRIAATFRRKVLLRVVAGGGLWAIAGAMSGVLSPFELIAEEPGMGIGVLVVFVLAVSHGFAVIDGVGRDLARGFCRGRLSGTGDVRHVVGPPGTIATALTGLLGGLCVGGGAAVVIRLVWGEPDAAAVLGWVLGPVAVLFLWALARARRAWAAARRERETRAAVLAYGVHVVGTIGSFRHQELWFDEQPSFLVDFDYEVAGTPVERQIVLWDHAIWAPVEGSRFDVWYDPDAPDDLSRTFIERRYAGECFARDPERFRLQEGVEWKAGALAPAWLTEDRRTGVTPSRATAARPVLTGLVAVVTAAALPTLVDVAWWTLGALAFAGVLACANLVTAARFLRRGRAFLSAGHTFDAAGIRCRAGVLAVLGAVVTDPALTWRPLLGESPWTIGHLLVGLALLICSLQWDWQRELDRTARELNPPAPPEPAQEALTGHDDSRIDRLEREHGYAVSSFLFTA